VVIGPADPGLEEAGAICHLSPGQHRYVPEKLLWDRPRGIPRLLVEQLSDPSPGERGLSVPPPLQGAGALPAALAPDPAFPPDAAVADALARARGHLRAVPDGSLDLDAAVRSLTPRLQRYATRRLGDRHEAADLVQEALLRAYQHRRELRTEDDLAAWTTCVTGRLVIDRLRVRGRSTSVAEVPEGTRAARDTADVVVARDQARMALDALDAMPSRQAAVLWAREVEGLGYDAIGDRFAMTEPAVRSLLTRARKALRKEYATRGGTLPGTGLVLLAPWASGTGWLERLRGGLERGPGMAALGVAGVGLVTGALVVPLLPSAPETRLPAVTRTALPEAAPQAGPVPAAAPAPTPAVAVTTGSAAAPLPAGTAAAPSAPDRPTTTTPLEDTGLDGTCASVGESGAGGADCAAAPTQRELSIELPVDASPAGVELPTVSTDRIPCSRLPDAPPTRCTDPGDDQ
jgi:RNA polymerase sigma-70 factor (ECF subfamily)